MYEQIYHTRPYVLIIIGNFLNSLDPHVDRWWVYRSPPASTKIAFSQIIKFHWILCRCHACWYTRKRHIWEEEIEFQMAFGVILLLIQLNLNLSRLIWFSQRHAQNRIVVWSKYWMCKGNLFYLIQHLQSTPGLVSLDIYIHWCIYFRRRVHCCML